MHRSHAIRAQLRGLGSVALTGFLVSVLATTQTFAQSASLSTQPAPQTATTPAATVPQNANLTTNMRGNSIPSSNSSVAELSLPSAPAPVPDATPAPGQQVQNLTSSPSSNSHRVKRPGQLAVGIAGAAIFAFGTYVTARATRDQGLAAALFMAPGAVMMGFGFTLAFKPKH